MLLSLHNFIARTSQLKYTAPVLVGAAAFFICVRAIFEITVVPISAPTEGGVLFFTLLHVFIWIFLWYGACFAMGLVWFRYMAGVALEKTLYILLATALLWIPMFHVWSAGADIRFTLLSYDDPTLFLSILTLMYASPSNHFMFIEFLAMGVGVIFAVFLFTRNIIRAFLTALGIYLSFIFIQFFFYICGEEECVFVVPSGLFSPAFVSLYVIVLFCAWLLILLYPEIRRYVLSPDTVFTRASARTLGVFLALCAVVNTLISPFVYDILFLFAVETIFFYTVLFLSAHFKEEQYLGFNVFLTMYGIFSGVTLLGIVLF